MVRLVNPQRLSKLDSVNNVVWAALEKIGNKELRAEALDDGSQHSIAMRIDGNVNGLAFSQSIESILAVGHAQTRVSSVTPQVPELIAHILSKLNRATQNRLLQDIPTEFEANEFGLPEGDSELVDASKQMLRKLRSTKTVSARGAIRCEYVF